MDGVKRMVEVKDDVGGNVNDGDSLGSRKGRLAAMRGKRDEEEGATAKHSLQKWQQLAARRGIREKQTGSSTRSERSSRRAAVID